MKKFLRKVPDPNGFIGQFPNLQIPAKSQCSIYCSKILKTKKNFPNSFYEVNYYIETKI